MKDWRFFFGAAFGMVAVYLFARTEWPSWPVELVVFVVLFVVAQHVVHKIAIS